MNIRIIGFVAVWALILGALLTEGKVEAKPYSRCWAEKTFTVQANYVEQNCGGSCQYILVVFNEKAKVVLNLPSGCTVEQKICYNRLTITIKYPDRVSIEINMSVMCGEDGCMTLSGQLEVRHKKENVLVCNMSSDYSCYCGGEHTTLSDLINNLLEHGKG